MWDQLSCIKGFRIKSKYLEALSIGAPRLDTSHLPGTALIRWCILGRKYKFLRFPAFLKIIIKIYKLFLRNQFMTTEKFNYLITFFQLTSE